MLIVLRAFGLLWLALCLFGCDQQPEKTDSMLFREAVIKRAQIPLKKAAGLLSPAVVNAPAKSLDTLIIARNALADAQRVYRQSQISNYQDPELQRLSAYFAELEPVLVAYAKSLLLSTITHTVELRTQIEEAKNQPYSARANDSSQLVAFLADQYNQQVKACCLNRLSQIDQLLSHNAASHRQLLVLIRSINQKLGKIIKQPDYATTLRNTIDAI